MDQPWQQVQTYLNISIPREENLIRYLEGLPLQKKRKINECICIFVFIYLPHDYNNYKKMPKKNVGRHGNKYKRISGRFMFAVMIDRHVHVGY